MKEMPKERIDNNKSIIDAGRGLNALHQTNSSKQVADVETIQHGMDVLANLSQVDLDRLLKSLKNGNEK